MNIVVGITGATGVVYAISLLKHLKAANGIKTHVVVSKTAAQNIRLETAYSTEELLSLADYRYDNDDLAAPIASGSYVTHAAVIVPCSMKSLSSVACGFADSLIARACDVTMKERRTLIICPRETPLNAIHLENMLKLSRLGVHIVPPMPAFYSHPQTIDDIVSQHTMKLLDLLGIENELGRRWNGPAQ